MPANTFKLLPEQFIPDKFSGAQDLLVAHGLQRIAAVVLAGNLKFEDYLVNLKHFRGFNKGHDLAPLADHPPTSVPPSFAAFSDGALASAFTLQPGAFSLEQSELGVPIDVKALGSPQYSAPSAAPSAAAPGKKPALKLKLKGKGTVGAGVAKRYN